MTDPVLSVRDLVVRFRSHDGQPFTAVNGVSLDIGPGETFGLVGETGCGKSTLARAALRLVDFQDGQVRLLGQDLAELDGKELRRLRRRCQMIFQDPRGSLDPRMSVGRIIGEPLRVHGLADRGERADRVREMMDLVGLPDELFDRRPVQALGRSAAAGGDRPGPDHRAGPGGVATSRCRLWTCRSGLRSSTCWPISGTAWTWPFCSSPTIWPWSAT